MISFCSGLSWFAFRLEPDLLSSLPTLSEPEFPAVALDPEPVSDDEGTSEGAGVVTGGAETDEDVVGVVDGLADGPLDGEAPLEDPLEDDEPPEDDEPAEFDDDVVDVCPFVVVDAVPDEPRSAFVVCCSNSLEDGAGASFSPSLNSSLRRCRTSGVTGWTGRGAAAPVMRMACDAVTSTPAPNGWRVKPSI